MLFAFSHPIIFCAYPCKIRTGILAGSRCDLGGGSRRDPVEILADGIFLPGGNLAEIPARFSPGSEIPGGQNLAGILPRNSPKFSPRSNNPGSQNLGAILLWISPRLSPGSKNPGGQNLARILPRISPRISPRSKIPGGTILPWFSPWFSPGSNNPGGQNLAGIPPRISPRFSPRSKFTVAKISVRSCRESRQDWRREAKLLVRFPALGKILDTLPRISFRWGPMFTCLRLKYKQK